MVMGINEETGYYDWIFYDVLRTYNHDEPEDSLILKSYYYAKVILFHVLAMILNIPYYTYMIKFKTREKYMKTDFSLRFATKVMEGDRRLLKKLLVRWRLVTWEMIQKWLSE